MKVLFADSDRDLLACYAVLFVHNGYEIKTVFDGTQAIMQIANTQFDLAILNAALPLANTEQLIRLLNQTNTPVLLLTTQRGQASAWKAQPDAVLAFPFLPSELFGIIRALTAGEQG